MDAAFYDLAFRRGDTATWKFLLRRDDNTAFDISNSEIRFVLENDPRGCGSLIKSTADGTAVLGNPLDGEVSLVLDGDETARREVGDRLRWELQRIVRSQAGAITEKLTLIEGRQIVTEGLAPDV